MANNHSNDDATTGSGGTVVGGGGGVGAGASGSSAVAAAEVAAALVDDLVLSVLPSARPRRGESERRARERAELRDDMNDLAAEILDGRIGSTAVPDEADVTESIKRKLSRYAVDGGHGTSVRYEGMLRRLKAQAGAPRRLPAVLKVMEELAFTSTAATATAANANANAATSRADGRVASSALATSSDARAARSGSDAPPRAQPSARGPTDRAGSGASGTAAAAAAAPSSSLGRGRPSQDGVGRPRGAAAERVAVAEPRGPPVPKAVMVERWRTKMGRPRVAEHELLRDVLFLLQGISGTHVFFEEERQSASNEPGGAAEELETLVHVRFREDQGGVVDPPTRALIHRIAELGRLYRRISEFAQTRAAADTSGLIMQSLCHFISNELSDYYRLIAVLEAHLNQGPPRASSEPTTGEETTTTTATATAAAPYAPGVDELDRRGASQGLTLRRVAVWSEDMALRLRLLSTVIESCRDAHGGALVSLIHSYTFNGDPFIRSFTAQLLEEVSRPFFHTLSRWIYEGELQDPFKEFFVEMRLDARRSSAMAAMMGGGGGGGGGEGGEATEADDAVSLWQDKFAFRAEMLPSFLGEGFARKIFSTGKSLNFIRHSCGDSDWVDTRDRLGQAGKDLRYTDLAGLERTIDSAYAIASTRLLDIFLDKFKLLEHLRALKDYLMLARGDFVDRLMESIGPSLNRPASSLFRHNLTASLETAVRGSNAQFDDPDVLRRLDARTLEYAPGDDGWEVFTLEYKVDSPVNAVLDARAMLGYQTLFAHLWRIKRVEVALGASWQRLVSVTGLLRRSTRRTSPPEFHALLRHASRTLVRLSEMVHFARQLQGFCQLEVIEYSWQDLRSFFARRQGDLDELISSHQAYLNALVGKALLRGGKRGSVDHLAHELRANMETCLAFCHASDDVASYLSTELARLQLDVTLPAPPAVGATAGGLAGLERRVVQHSQAFRERTQNIIARLAKHSNLVVRDLGTRLNFNGTYPTTPATSSAATAIKEWGERGERGGGGDGGSRGPRDPDGGASRRGGSGDGDGDGDGGGGRGGGDRGTREGARLAKNPSTMTSSEPPNESSGPPSATNETAGTNKTAAAAATSLTSARGVGADGLARATSTTAMPPLSSRGAPGGGGRAAPGVGAAAGAERSMAAVAPRRTAVAT